MSMHKALIMAGGRGERFWPQSRVNMPKQCLKILGNTSMVQTTVDRLLPIFKKEDIYLVTGHHLQKCISEECPDIKYVIEPCAKDTAACIGLGILQITQEDPNAIVFIETTDHMYNQNEIYHNHVNAAIELAKDDKIVLIGIKPSHPHTGFGYIQQGELYKEVNDISSYNIQEFKEKPDKKTAKEYIDSGDYLWNSGMFITKASVMLETMKKYMPDLHEALMKIKESNFDQKVLENEFQKLEKISIDYGIMEKAENTMVIRGEMHWYDIGDWDAMAVVHPKDDRDNIIKANWKGTASNCIIYGDEERLIKTEGVSDLIIVDTNDSLLICKKGKSQMVKQIVKDIEKENASLFLDYSTPKKLWIDIKSSNCDMKGDYVIGLIDVHDLRIEKNEKGVTITAL